MIGATLLVQFTKKSKYTIFAITMADINKALVLKKHTNPVIKVLLEYYKHLIIFLQKETDKLVECQPYNYKIIIKEGKHPRFRPLYKIS